MNCQTFNKVLSMDNEGNSKKILHNSKYKQEFSMVFTESALCAWLVVESPCQSVCVSVTLRHLSHLTCHMSPITCNVSHPLFYNIFFFKKKIIQKYLFNFCLMGQSGLSSWWRVFYQCGLTHLVVSEVLCQHGIISCLSMLHRMIDQMHF